MELKLTASKLDELSRAYKIDPSKVATTVLPIPIPVVIAGELNLHAAKLGLSNDEFLRRIFFLGLDEAFHGNPINEFVMNENAGK